MKQMFTMLQQQAAKLLVLSASVFFTATTHAQQVIAGLSSAGGNNGRGTAFSIKTDGTGFTVIKSFEDWGKVPNGDLYRNSTDGLLYGMTSTGGTYGAGTIFKMTTSGAVTIIRHFNPAPDGGYPLGELIKAIDGNFYGFTSGGGANGYGTIFKLSASGVYTVLKHFAVNTDGANPKGHLIQGKDSAFYGITYGGGTNGYGTIFKITAAGTYSVLRHLNSTTDGGRSYSSLTEGTDGNLYGLTNGGGSWGFGTVFKITKAGVFTVLRHLNSTTDGAYPQGDLIRATDGNFYGTCYSGGTAGNGTVFKITPTGTYTVLRNLAASTDGGNPYGNLYQNNDGLLYGLNRTGGANTSGTAYKISTTGTFTLLHSFVAATEGAVPNGTLIKSTDGNFYGFTSASGAYGGGTAFRMSAAGAVTVIAHFNGAKYGNAPMESLVKGKDSAYYGTTSTGGAYGYGVIFKICAGVTTTLYSFNKPVSGGTPSGSLVQATDGNFYGTTSEGGTNGYGTIFRVSPTGSFAVIRHLSAVTDGAYCKGSLVQGKDSLLYGMTSAGGSNAGGTIFKMSLSGAFTVLRHLANATDGANPEGGLVQGTDGNFYGMTNNNARIFKISSAGVFTVIRTLSGTTDGYYPYGSLIQHRDGNFYGINSGGGSWGHGTIFRLSATGTYTVLKHFNGPADGKTPNGSLLMAADGNLYGLTSAGGTNNAGTIFRITTAGVFTVLRHLNLSTDGGNPMGSLIIAPVNNLLAAAQSVTTNEDVAKAITLSGSGGSPFSFNIVTAPAKGTVTSGATAARTYTPAANYNGVDSFAFNVSVGCMASAPAYVKISIAAVADTPVLATIGNKTVIKDSLLAFKASAADADAGQVITYSLIGAPTGAVINAATGNFSWKPAATGTYVFKVRATDNGTPVLFDEEQITVTVTATLAARMLQQQIPDHMMIQPVYPNPGHDWLMVPALAKATDAFTFITDMNGQVFGNRRYTIGADKKIKADISFLIPGSYVITIKEAGCTYSYQFIKQ